MKMQIKFESKSLFLDYDYKLFNKNKITNIN